MKSNCNKDSLKNYDRDRINFKQKTSSMNINIKKTLVVLLFLFSSNIYTQDLTDNLKCWTEIRVSYKITPTLKAKFGQLFAFNISPFGYSFSQTELSLAYRLKRRTYIEGGYVRGLFKDSKSLRKQGASSDLFNTLSVDRVFVKFSYKHNIAKRVSLKHKIEFQYFLLDLNKYKTRSIYSAKVSYHVRRSSLTPFLECRFYFYRGGEISNGFKRFRLKTGLRFNPIKGFPMRATLYVLFQNEFNTEQLSDNDYTVLGSTLSFRIK